MMTTWIWIIALGFSFAVGVLLGWYLNWLYRKFSWLAGHYLQGTFPGDKDK